MSKEAKWKFVNGRVICSACGAQPYKNMRVIDFDNLFVFCPECGLKMSGNERAYKKDDDTYSMEDKLSIDYFG